MTSIGKYQILEELGVGSMGTVYRARDSVLDREVALKTIRAGQSIEPEIKERFYREARACARLQHPHIVTIHDFGEVDDTAYISMELLVGEDLRKIIEAHRRIPLHSQIEIIAQVSDALSHAHQNGVIHRDIKPSNIFVLTDNSAKVLDFGVARLSESRLTVVGRVLGTPNYMAPEQIKGNICDARSDLFSLAIVFFELLTGIHPFHSSMIPRRIVDGEPDMLCGVDPTFPESIERVLDQALQKHPDKRFQTADEFAAVLRGVIEELVGHYGALKKDHLSDTSIMGQETALAGSSGSQTQILESGDRRASEFFRLMEECDRAVEDKRLDAARQALQNMKQLAAVDSRFGTAVREYEHQVLAMEGVSIPGAGSVSDLPGVPHLPSRAPTIAQASIGGGGAKENRASPSTSTGDVTRLFSMRAINAAATTTAHDSGSFEDADVRARESIGAPPISERVMCASCGAQNKLDSRFCVLCGNELGKLSSPAMEAIPQIDEEQIPSARTHHPAASSSSTPLHRELSTHAGNREVYLRLAVGVCLAGLILIGVLAARVLKVKRVVLWPAVGTALVTAESADLLASPSPQDRRTSQLRKGTRLNVIRIPQSLNPEWLAVQQLDGTRAMAPGYVRAAALGHWSTFQLARLFDPGDSADLQRRIAYLQVLRFGAVEFKNPEDQSGAWLEIARQSALVAKEKKASSPSSDEWRSYLIDVRNALSKISSDHSVAQQSNAIEQQVLGLIEPPPPVPEPAEPAPGPSRPKYDTRADYQSAQDSFRLGQYPKAILLLERVLAADENNQEARTLLKRVHKAAAEEAAASGIHP